MGVENTKKKKKRCLLCEKAFFFLFFFESRREIKMRVFRRRESTHYFSTHGWLVTVISALLFTPGREKDDEGRVFLFLRARIRGAGDEVARGGRCF